jgi:hypothetical protein
MRRTNVLAALALTLGACQPSTVDLVQPGAVAKATFDGEWLWLDSVAEVPYGSAATFTGAQRDLERLRWRVEEELLIGYRTYDHVEGTTAADPLDADDLGPPIVAYRIEKHFDIRRAYDRRTGEESNVVQEDMERPWFEREYMRVDWTTNVADAAWTYAGVDLQVLDFGTEDPSELAAPQLDDTDGDGIIDSVLLTTKVLAQPDSYVFPGYGNVPVCLFFGRAMYECAASEVTIRSSFVRVDERAPYQGLAYNDHWMETYGFFATERMAYDRGQGLLEAERTFWANRHDLFAGSFETDPSGDVRCVATLGPRAGEERTCITFRADDGPEPIPLDPRERELVPIVYHAGPGFPEAYLDAMAEVAAEWNEPLQDTVGDLRFWACVDDGGSEGDCDAERVVDEELFVFCPHNPSRPGDPEVCSTDHTGPDRVPDGVPDLALPGDLRYSFVHLVDQPQLSSPYGYGPSAADPVGTRLTLADGTLLELGAGEIVSANAYLYSSVLDRVATQTADLVQLINGEIDPEDFITGEHVGAFAEALAAGDPTAFGTTAGVSPVWSEEQVATRASKISNGFSPLLRAHGATARVQADPLDTIEAVHQATDRIQRDALMGGPADGLARFEAMASSPYADQLWSDEVIGAMGYDPGSSPDLSARSPLDLVHPMRQAELEDGRIVAGQHAVDLDEELFTEPSLLGRAKQYAQQGLDREAIIADVKQNAFKEVVLHEVGHTFGLRHNFAGSFDAFNFPDAYWTLRDDGRMAPRHVDPETDAEIEGGIRELAYASIMDYGGGSTTGWHGLGKYDKAAIKFGYGQMVEVMDKVQPRPFVQGASNEDMIGFISVFNGSNVYPSPLLQLTNGGFLEMHYTDYPKLALLDRRVDVPLDRLVPVFAGEEGFDGMFRVADGAGVVEDGAPAAPYRFCSDEFAIGMTCARFDEGADAYEAQRFFMDQYFNHYLLNNFSRGRYGYGNAASYVNRLQGRIFGPLGQWQRYYALFHGIFEADTDPVVQDFFAADRGFGGWTAATDESFRFLTQVVTRPEPGDHGKRMRPDGHELLVPSFDGPETIPLGVGAYYESEWASDSGYHWFERQSRVGSYWDRMLALLALTDTSADGFMGYDTAADPRAYSIGYQDLYRDPLAMFLGRLMSDELNELAPVLDDDGRLVYPDPLDLQASWPPPGADAVEPAAYWLVQFDAGLFGKALLARGYDRSFLNRSRIYVEGSGNAIVPPEDQPTVRFTDPYSGKTYVAWSFPALEDGIQLVRNGTEPVELGSGARMLRHAQALAERCFPEEVDGAPVTVSLLDQEAACAELERYATDLDLQLQLYAFFDGQAPE